MKRKKILDFNGDGMVCGILIGVCIDNLAIGILLGYVIGIQLNRNR